MRLNHKELVKK